ncbi:MAG: hypothetical protein ACYTBJ_27155 [Planctomycetota bacterium]|jgi:hypothetical protein
MMIKYNHSTTQAFVDAFQGHDYRRMYEIFTSNILPVMKRHEEVHRELISVFSRKEQILDRLISAKDFSRAWKYLAKRQAAQIAQLKNQLADETAERKRLEDNEDAMVAYHDELARDLAEADDAIEKCWFAHNQTTNIYMCKTCGSVGFILRDLEHKKSCTAAKAKARIEARKGKPK